MRTAHLLPLVLFTTATLTMAVAVSCGDDTGKTVDAAPDLGADQKADQAGEQAVATLTDGQIWLIALTANNGEVSEGKVAQVLASPGPVQSFALNMQNSHSAALTRLATVRNDQGITPAESTQQDQLLQQQATSLANITSKAGTEFDIAYIQDQVTTHQQWITLLDTLIAQAQNAALKSELQTEKSEAQTHLSDAQTRLAVLVPDGGVDAM